MGCNCKRGGKRQKVAASVVRVRQLTLTSSVIDDVEDVDLLLLVGNGEQSGAGEAQSRALRRLGVDGPEKKKICQNTEIPVIIQIMNLALIGNRFPEMLVPACKQVPQVSNQLLITEIRSIA